MGLAFCLLYFKIIGRLYKHFWKPLTKLLTNYQKFWLNKKKKIQISNTFCQSCTMVPAVCKNYMTACQKTPPERLELINVLSGKTSNCLSSNIMLNR